MLGDLTLDGILAGAVVGLSVGACLLGVLFARLGR